MNYVSKIIKFLINFNHNIFQWDGLVRDGDSFPDGCPLGHDPLAIARKMAEKSITLYTAGVEPSIAMDVN